MKAKQSIAAFAAGLLALGGAAMPLGASAGIFDGITYGYEATYSVGYGPGTSMCPPYEYNYYSCPSGIGGLFGAQPGYGGYGSSYGAGYGYASPYQQYYTSYQMPQYQYYPQQYNAYNMPQQQHAYYPQQDYYYQYQPNYNYEYYDHPVYAPAIGSPIIYYSS